MRSKRLATDRVAERETDLCLFEVERNAPTLEFPKESTQRGRDVRARRRPREGRTQEAQASCPRGGARGRTQRVVEDVDRPREFSGEVREDEAQVLNVQAPEALLPRLAQIFESCGGFAGYPELRLQGLDFVAAFEQARPAGRTLPTSG